MGLKKKVFLFSLLPLFDQFLCAINTTIISSPKKKHHYHHYYCRHHQHYRYHLSLPPLPFFVNTQHHHYHLCYHPHHTTPSPLSYAHHYHHHHHITSATTKSTTPLMPLAHQHFFFLLNILTWNINDFLYELNSIRYFGDFFFFFQNCNQAQRNKSLFLLKKAFCDENKWNVIKSKTISFNKNYK